MRSFSLCCLSLLWLMACQRQTNVAPSATTLLSTTFERDTDGWVADYSDYGVAQAALMAFDARRTTLPAPLDTRRHAMRLTGSNRSDDMFMFLKRRLTGLRPNAEYRLQFEVELASNYATNSVGIGGSPGTSVFLKVGASANEPVKVLKTDHYELNIDKGNQSQRGREMIVVGNVATGVPAAGVPAAGNDVVNYRLIQRHNRDQPFTARTNDRGELWVIVGTDSGFEGVTTLYYTQITVSTL